MRARTILLGCLLALTLARAAPARATPYVYAQGTIDNPLGVPDTADVVVFEARGCENGAGVTAVFFDVRAFAGRRVGLRVFGAQGARAEAKLRSAECGTPAALQESPQPAGSASAGRDAAFTIPESARYLELWVSGHADFMLVME
jgi:hypothetical protein